MKGIPVFSVIVKFAIYVAVVPLSRLGHLLPSTAKLRPTLLFLSSPTTFMDVCLVTDSTNDFAILNKIIDQDDLSTSGQHWLC